MNKQGSVLTEEQFRGAPIERAHLHRGFTSKKTPLKWIRFFRACVLQRDYAKKKNQKENKLIWLITLAIIIFSIVINYNYKIPYIVIIVITVVAAIILSVKNKSNYTRKYSDGFDFFSDYFSAFFTLIEEDLQPQSKISLVANVKSTKEDVNLIREDTYESTTKGFVSGKNLYYQKEISKGSCLFSDGCILSFSFTERLRNRVVEKIGSVSRKRKTKIKFKSIYPFVLKMKIPKTKYLIKSEVDTTKIELAEDSNFYIIKTTRKFDIKNEEPDKYEPYSASSIEMFSTDYFALELINLINVSYSCVTPRV